MSVSTEIQSMITHLTELQSDVEKHEKGQKAAGTRIRKAMQEVKASAQTVRAKVLEDQKSEG